MMAYLHEFDPLFLKIRNQINDHKKELSEIKNKNFSKEMSRDYEDEISTQTMNFMNLGS